MCNHVGHTIKKISESNCMLDSDTWNGKNENTIKYWVHPGNIVRGFPGSSIGKESACNGGDPALIPGLERSSEERMGYPLQYSWASLVAQLVKESARSVGRSGFSSWVGKIPWRKENYPLQYSGLEYPMDCTVHAVSQSWTQLINFHFPSNNLLRSTLSILV